MSDQNVTYRSVPAPLDLFQAGRKLMLAQKQERLACCVDRIINDDAYWTKGPAGPQDIAYRDAAKELAQHVMLQVQGHPEQQETNDAE